MILFSFGLVDFLRCCYSIVVFICITPGAAVGGALGGWMTSGQFKPLPEILMEMSPKQQEQLYSDVMAIVGTLKWTEVVQLIAQVNGNASLHEQVLGAVLNFTKNQLKAEVKYED